jgi:hypothetical protein
MGSIGFSKDVSQKNDTAIRSKREVFRNFTKNQSVGEYSNSELFFAVPDFL